MRLGTRLDILPKCKYSKTVFHVGFREFVNVRQLLIPWKILFFETLMVAELAKESLVLCATRKLVSCSEELPPDPLVSHISLVDVFAYHSTF
jgi:hypothetical protein